MLSLLLPAWMECGRPGDWLGEKGVTESLNHFHSRLQGLGTCSLPFPRLLLVIITVSLLHVPRSCKTEAVENPTTVKLKSCVRWNIEERRWEISFTYASFYIQSIKRTSCIGWFLPYAKSIIMRSCKSTPTTQMIPVCESWRTRPPRTMHEWGGQASVCVTPAKHRPCPSLLLHCYDQTFLFTTSVLHLAATFTLVMWVMVFS